MRRNACAVIRLAAASLAGASVLFASWIPYQISYQRGGSEPDYGNKPEGHRKLLVLADIIRAVRPDVLGQNGKLPTGSTARSITAIAQ